MAKNPHELGTIAFKVFGLFDILNIEVEKLKKIMNETNSSISQYKKQQAEKDLDYIKIFFHDEINEFVYPFLKSEADNG